MMSATSKTRLATAVAPLQRLFEEVAKTYDITVIWGHRGQVDQDIAFKQGNTKLMWPSSKHNRYPSAAVDVMPLPLDWKDIKRLHEFATFVKGVADKMEIKVVWGGNFPSFFDGPHWEVA